MSCSIFFPPVFVPRMDQLAALRLAVVSCLYFVCRVEGYLFATLCICMYNIPSTELALCSQCPQTLQMSPPLLTTTIVSVYEVLYLVTCISVFQVAFIIFICTIREISSWMTATHGITYSLSSLSFSTSPPTPNVSPRGYTPTCTCGGIIQCLIQLFLLYSFSSCLEDGTIACTEIACSELHVHVPYFALCL